MGVQHQGVWPLSLSCPDGLEGSTGLGLSCTRPISGLASARTLQNLMRGFWSGAGLSGGSWWRIPGEAAVDLWEPARLRGGHARGPDPRGRSGLPPVIPLSV